MLGGGPHERALQSQTVNTTLTDSEGLSILRRNCAQETDPLGVASDSVCLEDWDSERKMRKEGPDYNCGEAYVFK